MNPADSLDSARIIAKLEQGGVLACPSESVWGLSCDPFNPQAVAKLNQLKHRNITKSLILVTGHSQHLAFLLDSLPKYMVDKAFQYWQGGNTTLLIPDIHSFVPDWLIGNYSNDQQNNGDGKYNPSYKYNKVAVRLSQHQPLVDLSGLWNNLIVSTSANPTGKEPARTIDQLFSYFNNLDCAADNNSESEQLGLICGELGNKQGVSSIIDLENGRVLR